MTLEEKMLRNAQPGTSSGWHPVHGTVTQRLSGCGLCGLRACEGSSLRVGEGLRGQQQESQGEPGLTQAFIHQEPG